VHKYDLEIMGGGGIHKMKSSPTMGTNTLLMQRSLTSKNSAVTGTIHKGQRPYFDIKKRAFHYYLATYNTAFMK
jgi:hypothetical protein